MRAAKASWQELTTPFASYLRNVASGSVDHKIVIEIVRDTDISTLTGAETCIGYGTSDTEMLPGSLYCGAGKVQ